MSQGPQSKIGKKKTGTFVALFLPANALIPPSPQIIPIFLSAQLEILKHRCPYVYIEGVGLSRSVGNDVDAHVPAVEVAVDVDVGYDEVFSGKIPSAAGGEFPFWGEAEFAVYGYGLGGGAHKPRFGLNEVVVDVEAPREVKIDVGIAVGVDLGCLCRLSSRGGAGGGAR